ncbi:uncharacterized protein LOC123015066 [Tribolium madens]|uniref:uncharacterized protein LOC123015066 n=1 Tax=Tribolium madens TaxID=41895 RepID=UPI001CF74943|nr:uncharacterized protein LOC123015066 [Tribolium madens]XP_044270445.1 uncharacterized protein LOC123015066 [Tribolium madens]XP_044270446.1 uncharacterized protein LOC123015066 [Tribolium madens]
MALVSYDYESGSDNEEQEEPSSSSEVIINKTKDKEENNEETTDNNELPEILSHLPQTKSTPSTVNVTEDKLEDFIPKYEPPPKEKKTQKVKITIPKLSDFEEDEEEPEKKKKKTAAKNSGLLSILPPVRGSPLSTKSFVPNVLKNKPPVTEKSKANSMVPQAVKKNAEMAKKAVIKKITKGSSSDIESDDDIEVPETFDDEMWQKVCGRNNKPKPQVVKAEEVPVTPVINIAPEPEKPYDGLDNAAFKELVGKAKRPVNIKLVDINEEEILPDKEIWMTKSLTDPDSAPKPVIEEPVDPTRKKKHHITYLAEQAKLNEQEFQSQWSSSKYARNQTRAKYGF